MGTVFVAFTDLFRQRRPAVDIAVQRFIQQARPWLTNKQIPWYFMYGSDLAPFGGDAFSIPRRSRPRYEKPTNIPVMLIRDFTQPGWPVVDVLNIRVANMPGGGEGTFPPHHEAYMLLFEHMVRQGLVDRPYIQENPQLPGMGFILLAAALAAVTLCGTLHVEKL